MNWGNAYVCSSITKDQAGKYIAGMDFELRLDGKFEKIIWLEVTSTNLILVGLVAP